MARLDASRSVIGSDALSGVNPLFTNIYNNDNASGTGIIGNTSSAIVERLMSDTGEIHWFGCFACRDGNDCWCL